MVIVYALVDRGRMGFPSFENVEMVTLGYIGLEIPL